MQSASDRQASAAMEALRESARQREISVHMLQEARKQHLLEIRPLVVVDYADENSFVGLKVRNIGRGPAFRVDVSTISGESASLIFATVQLLQIDEDETLTMKVTRQRNEG